MQINRFTKIVIFVTSLGFTFLAALRFFIFSFCFSSFCFALFVRMRLGYFASAEATTGFALWIPTTFEKVDETLSVLVLLLLLCGFCYAATAAACYPPTYGKLNAAALIKIKKLS